MSAAVTFEKVSKKYSITRQNEPHRMLLQEAMMRGLRGLRLRLTGGAQTAKSRKTEDFWALNDVSFSLDKGERLAVIGRNGAGKSTLLKLVGRITDPTCGTIRVRGRLASLLEVGTGFHPELTGRENIYLNGIILGMNRREIDGRFDEIVQFAEIERFLDTPVKRYSSGMYVRLAFSVAAHVDTDILVVDEVLAVGDLRFQDKCLAKLRDSTTDGRTVIFVSHNMTAVARLCNKGLVLDQGRIRYLGNVAEAIGQYVGESRGGESLTWDRPAMAPPASLELVSATGEMRHSELELKLEFQSNAPHASCYVVLDFMEAAGTTIMQAMPSIRPYIGFEAAGARQTVSLAVELPGLVPGNYDVSIWHGSHNTDTMEWWKKILRFNVLDSPVEGRTYPHPPEHGFVVAKSRLLEPVQ